MSQKNKRFYSTKNKLLMDYAMEYIECMKLDWPYYMKKIEWKKIILLYQFFGYSRRKWTIYYRSMHEISAIN